MRGCATKSWLTRTSPGNGRPIFQRRKSLELADSVATGLNRHLRGFQRVLELRDHSHLLVAQPGEKLPHARLEVLQPFFPEDCFELALRVVCELLPLDRIILQGFQDD